MNESLGSPLAIFVHGLNLYDKDWERCVWGVPPKALGRVPKALHLLLTEYSDAEAIVFGSGATKRGEVFESEETLRYLFENFNRLREFDEFRDLSVADLERLYHNLVEIEEVQTTSVNTYTELEHAIPQLFKRGIRRLVLVSEKTHVSRCHVHGEEILEKLGLSCEMDLIPRGSPALPPHVTASNVVIFEPQGDDRDKVVPNLKRIFKIPAEGREAFNEGLGQLLTNVGA
ncbi:hypothetical protein C4585_02270 [Candidatus Parcubacteria bacterium]|nr:MAG: hypothetical protein C4585_02270 [Candidatus Parcubacteria bacterium]